MLKNYVIGSETPFGYAQGSNALIALVILNASEVSRELL